MAGVKASTLFFALFATWLLFNYVVPSRFESIKNDLKESQKLRGDATNALDAVLSDSHAKYNKDLGDIKEIAKHGDSNIASYAKQLEKEIENTARDGFSSSV
ncbi:hypothetical protein AVEN_130361-1 [Araneus ventricosus]|uniref:Uncharacterized protein n=1 Tax=Araneus ventricosus TaxID=182803 RepID=A0A4Y2BDH0_ARAVE|nr:hypothetical protein AVEN_130361-1 [Araneus ventricosus]